MDADQWNDLRDQRLGAQGVGPYAELPHEDCACCGERGETPDLYEVGTDTGVWLCQGCFALLRDGDLATPDDVTAAIGNALAHADRLRLRHGDER